MGRGRLLDPRNAPSTFPPSSRSLRLFGKSSLLYPRLAVHRSTVRCSVFLEGEGGRTVAPTHRAADRARASNLIGDRCHRIPEQFYTSKLLNRSSQSIAHIGRNRHREGGALHHCTAASRACYCVAQ